MEQPSVSQADSDVVKESKQILKRKIKAKADKTNRPKPAPGSSVFRPLPAIPSQVEQKHLLQTAFKLALTGGTFIDTKFYAFSRRRSSGLIDKPLPLFANSSILRAACPYFEGLLARGFEEGKVTNIDEDYPSDRHPHTEEYDYDSDSDLDEEEDYDGLSGGMGNINIFHSLNAAGAEAVSDASLRKETSERMEQPEEHVAIRVGRLGRIVHIPDVAYNTLRAFVFYLCTGEVLFRPMKSSPKSEQSVTSQNEIDHHAPRCSPKSMYRLADRFGLSDLKILCLTEIYAQLKPQNIVPELFSEFTSRYPPIRDYELTYICNNSYDPIIADTLPAWIEAVTNGSLSHSTNVMTLLLPMLLRK